MFHYIGFCDADVFEWGVVGVGSDFLYCFDGFHAFDDFAE